LALNVRFHQDKNEEGDIHDRIDLDITTEVSGQITEMSTLLNDRSHIDRLVPPCWLGDGLVSGGLSSAYITMVEEMTHVSSIGSHDGKVVIVDNFLHVLDTS
jgi:hypothetical protein